MLDNGTIDEYAAKLSDIEQDIDLFKTVLGFEDVVGRLKAYKERVKEEDKANDLQENLLYARTEYSNGNNDLSEGSGRDSYSRGHGRDNEQKGKQHEKRDLLHIQCYRCDQYGHFVSKCPQRNRDYDANFTETHEGDMNHEEGKNGEQKLLNDFYYIPALRINVISLGQANISDYDISIRAQLKVGKEDTNEVGRESGTFTVLCNDIEENVTNQVVDEEANPHRSLVTVHETSLESEEDNFRSDDTPNPLVQLETIRLLIALALESTLKKIGFLQCVQDKAVYRKVPNGEFIIVAVNVDDLFMTGTSLDLINEFKKRIASQFKISDLDELTYYLGIKVSQGKDCMDIKQERYAMKILKEVGMEDCIATLCPMEPGLKLSKAKDEPEVEATQYQKVIGTTSFGIKYKRGNDMRLGGYSSHNVDIDDGRSEFMAATIVACLGIWLWKILAKVMKNDQVTVEHVSEENQRADLLTKALARKRFKEMRSLLGVQELPSLTQKFRG
ncbi:uncharacterized mitochondrial protein-like protein, partial [Tanacetum coccineum]